MPCVLNNFWHISFSVGGQCLFLSQAKDFGNHRTAGHYFNARNVFCAIFIVKQKNPKTRLDSWFDFTFMSILVPKFHLQGKVYKNIVLSKMELHRLLVCYHITIENYTCAMRALQILPHVKNIHVVTACSWGLEIFAFLSLASPFASVTVKLTYFSCWHVHVLVWFVFWKNKINWSSSF